METTITPLDPADQPAVAAAQALRVAAEAVDVPDFPAPCPYAFRGELTHPVPSRRVERYLAWVGGKPAGLLTIDLPLRENLDNAEVTLLVDPAQRRCGIGRALHAHLWERLAELGRQRYMTATVESLPGGPARLDSGRRFAEAVGASAALDEVRRRLDLTTVDEQALSAMRRQADGKAAGYRVVTWRERAPDEYVADISYLSSRLMSDAPTGDLVWEPSKADTERLRAGERQHAAGRWHLYSAGAVHLETDRMVAVTTLARQESSPWHAFQWITLVDPEHRGHRLGALVKLENLRFARAHEPELRVVDTWNAAVNQHMIAINEAIGFRPVDRWVNWQQEI